MCEQIAEIMVGFQSVCLCGLDQAVDGRTRVSPSGSVAKEPVGATDDKRSGGPLDGVIVGGEKLRIQVANDSRQLTTGVADCLSEFARRRNLLDTLTQPAHELLEYRPRLPITALDELLPGDLSG